MKNLFTMNDLSNEQIFHLLHVAEDISSQKEFPGLTKKHVGANLFFEPSTRTKMSFEMAASRLGIDLLSFSQETSSTQKGESLYDTVKTIEAIGASYVVIRHTQDQYYKELSSNISIPIINAGDGKGEHPTQCLLDLLTIYQEYGRFEDLNIAIAGDIAHSRVARSNANTLRRLGAKVYLVAPEEWQDETLNFPYLTLDEAVEVCDVLMLLRIQYERHSKRERQGKEAFHQQFGLTSEREKRMKPGSIIMHPAPVNRGVEIASDLVECERSRIFKQMTNGVAIRTAIIYQLLKTGGMKHVHFI